MKFTTFFDALPVYPHELHSGCFPEPQREPIVHRNIGDEALAGRVLPEPLEYGFHDVHRSPPGARKQAGVEPPTDVALRHEAEEAQVIVMFHHSHVPYRVIQSRHEFLARW